MQRPPILTKLSKFTDKKVRIDLLGGGYYVAIPQQWLEEDYDSFLVAIVETTEWAREGNLVELTENEIKDVQLV
ncbi:MAG: hypothetical protein M0Z55_02495 [Peptococcaceae bacterium]|nr:hypothetical protein [Peptococcaceae bacterium]